MVRKEEDKKDKLQNSYLWSNKIWILQLPLDALGILLATGTQPHRGELQRSSKHSLSWGEKTIISVDFPEHLAAVPL